jgi:hypothetical protein
MRKPYKPYIAQSLGELRDLIASMILNAPTFIDRTGYFSYRNIDTEFEELNGGLDNLRLKLGEQRYAKMREMSDQMRALFEADPEIKTGETIRGCEMLYEMDQMLRRKRAAPKNVADPESE